MFTDDDLRVEEIEVTSPLVKSDHTSIVFHCDIEPQIRKTEKIYLYERGNYLGMKEELSTDWKVHLNTENMDDVE